MSAPATELTRLFTLELRGDQDVVLARQRARQVAQLLGFGNQDQIRIATSVSELARNVVMYARAGTLELTLQRQFPTQLWVRVTDQGPGIARLEEILAGSYRSSTGMGLGLLGVRRLMNEFSVESTVGVGTEVRASKVLPATASLPTSRELSGLAQRLAQPATVGPAEVIVQQNQELMQALSALESKDRELERVNRELEETNRGVVALYAELEDKANALRRASDAKTSFLSSLTHELRSPLNSVQSLARLLLERVDGPLTDEQERQVIFIRRSAESLSEMINDLLDIAKIEAGRTELHPASFTLAELFGALRGMMRPLASSEAVQLVFEPAEALPPLFTDEGKLAQVLRNLISNALKYTEVGEVRVSAERAGGGRVRIVVRDTGIGIPADQQERIFEEFAQVEGPHQRKVKGTGLGLPLARKLTQLLGGELEVAQSVVGRGSTFALTLPAVLPESTGAPEGLEARWRKAEGGRQLLLVESEQAPALRQYDRLVDGTGYQVIGARTREQALAILSEGTVAAVILDLGADPGAEAGWDLLSELKSGAHAAVPVLVAGPTDEANRAAALGAVAFQLKPVPREWLLSTLEALRPAEDALPSGPVLVVDDDEVSRYLLRRLLQAQGQRVVEAAGGQEALERVRQERPGLIFLDLMMPQMSGFEVLEALAHDPDSAKIPVVIASSRTPAEADQRRLAHASAVLSKAELTAKTVAEVLGRCRDGWGSATR